MQVSHENHAPPELGDSKVCCAQNLPGHRVTQSFECSRDIPRKAHVSQALNVLEEETLGPQRPDEADEFEEHLIAGIVPLALSNSGEALTRWSPHVPVRAGVQPARQLGGTHLGDVREPRTSFAEVGLVGLHCVWPILDREERFPACLLQTQTQATRA
mgnify:CR=1 FL=1